jgi:hypothetical protein
MGSYWIIYEVYGRMEHLCSPSSTNLLQCGQCFNKGRLLLPCKQILTGPKSSSFEVKGRESDTNLSILKIDIASLPLVPSIHGSSLSFTRFSFF